MISRGHGSPVVLIPGIQGRWEWMASTVDALAERHRVSTFSLDRDEAVFEKSAERIDALLDSTGTNATAVVGVSFGGLLAAHYAATRPSRVTALVLVAAPSPRWPIDSRAERALRHPWAVAPAYAAGALRKLTPEIISALPTWSGRANFVATYVWRTLQKPVSPPAMARWVRDWMQTDITELCRRITARSLVVTGEPGLDRVVPYDSTRDYLNLIPGANHVVFKGTGHVGVVSKPREFARLVGDFIDAH